AVLLPRQPAPAGVPPGRPRTGTERRTGRPCLQHLRPLRGPDRPDPRQKRLPPPPGAPEKGPGADLVGEHLPRRLEAAGSGTHAQEPGHPLLLPRLHLLHPAAVQPDATALDTAPGRRHPHPAAGTGIRRRGHRAFVAVDGTGMGEKAGSLKSRAWLPVQERVGNRTDTCLEARRASVEWRLLRATRFPMVTPLRLYGPAAVNPYRAARASISGSSARAAAKSALPASVWPLRIFARPRQ